MLLWKFGCARKWTIRRTASDLNIDVLSKLILFNKVNLLVCTFLEFFFSWIVIMLSALCEQLPASLIIWWHLSWSWVMAISFPGHRFSSYSYRHHLSIDGFWPAYQFALGFIGKCGLASWNWYSNDRPKEQVEEGESFRTKRLELDVELIFRYDLNYFQCDYKKSTGNVDNIDSIYIQTCRNINVYAILVILTLTATSFITCDARSKNKWMQTRFPINKIFYSNVNISI